MITIILIVIAGVCNSIMDVLNSRYNKSIFNDLGCQQWINPSISHSNKWKNGNILEGERFLLSTTALVWLTDLWHFSKFIMLICLFIAIVTYQTIFGFCDFI